MVYCTRCKKRPAVIFITTMSGGEKKSEGLCLMCAREAKIPQVDDYMKQMGLSDDDIEELAAEIGSDGDSFEPGGSNTMPNFFSNFMNKMGGQKDGQEGETTQQSQRAQKDKKGGKELRFLNTYCTDLNQRAAEGKLDRIIGGRPRRESLSLKTASGSPQS